MNRFFLRILSVLALLLPLTANAAPVDEYPNGPITAVCTYSVGSQTDVQARICAMPAEKYFGQPHFLVHWTDGAAILAVNKLRTVVRQTELAAYKAFRDENGAVTREDILLGLNRLSSLMWIMMIKLKAGKYPRESG